MMKKILTLSLGAILVLFGLVVSAVMMPVDYVKWNPLATLQNALQETGGSVPKASQAEQESSDEAVQPVASADTNTEKIDFLLTDPTGNPGWWAEAAQKGLSSGDLQEVLLGWNSWGDGQTTHFQGGGGGFVASSSAAPSSLTSAAAYSALSGSNDPYEAPLQGSQDPVNNAVPFDVDPTGDVPGTVLRAVPESSTLILMVLGLALVAFSRWKKAVIL